MQVSITDRESGAALMLSGVTSCSEASGTLTIVWCGNTLELDSSGLDVMTTTRTSYE